MTRHLVLAWLIALCGAGSACLDDSAPGDDAIERNGPIVCIAYPCCGDGSCDEGETCLLCPQDCGCDPHEICVAGTAGGSVGDPGADAVCVADSAETP